MISHKIVSLVCVLCFILCNTTQARIENPVLFIGEVVKNGTDGAPLLAGANGQLVSGQLSGTFVGVAGTITVATSASYATMTGLTLSPLAGTYQVQCRTGIAHTTNNAAVLMAVHVAGTIVADSVATGTPFIQGGVTPSLAVPMVLYSNTETTITAGQAITCGWRTTAGTASSTPTRSIMINRIR